MVLLSDKSPMCSTSDREIFFRKFEPSSSELSTDCNLGSPTSTWNAASRGKDRHIPCLYKLCGCKAPELSLLHIERQKMEALGTESSLDIP
ncbi:uncharacterized protein N7483_006742 [Penicillium malachiteum]|uniref:uncharacterized protein n=1 Tax=Penicillium malachiteum TaxID=1324776 RepID=UPI0025472519|nr:uncharacterized protein N7483_006742 [Penicillium malachiteum]KAJ5725385.1 hypothetical protein N7483_006742 [Penicillium malachiteum]